MGVRPFAAVLGFVHQSGQPPPAPAPRPN